MIFYSTVRCSIDILCHSILHPYLGPVVPVLHQPPRSAVQQVQAAVVLLVVEAIERQPLFEVFFGQGALKQVHGFAVLHALVEVRVARVGKVLPIHVSSGTWREVKEKR